MLKFEPGIWMLPVFIVNIPFYTMEINHMLNENLKFTIAGELGPIEIEILFSSLLILSSTVLGLDISRLNSSSFLI